MRSSQPSIVCHVNTGTWSRKFHFFQRDFSKRHRGISWNLIRNGSINYTSNHIVGSIQKGSTTPIFLICSQSSGPVWSIMKVNLPPKFLKLLLISETVREAGLPCPLVLPPNKYLTTDILTLHSLYKDAGPRLCGHRVKISLHDSLLDCGWRRRTIFKHDMCA